MKWYEYVLAVLVGVTILIAVLLASTSSVFQFRAPGQVPSQGVEAPCRP